MPTTDRDGRDTAGSEPKRRGRPPKADSGLKSKYSEKFLRKIGEELAKSPSSLTDAEVRSVVENWRREKGHAGLEAYIEEWS